MRFLCLWACKSGSLEDFTNTLKAEALFLVFWFKALSSFLLPLVTTINDLSFYFLARLQTFSNLVCVWGGTTCTCVLVCMHVHIHGGQRHLELCCQPAKSRNPLVPISYPLCWGYRQACGRGCGGFKLRSGPLNDFSRSNFQNILFW